jgi:hypothetical protein
MYICCCCCIFQFYCCDDRLSIVGGVGRIIGDANIKHTNIAESDYGQQNIVIFNIVD